MNLQRRREGLLQLKARWTHSLACLGTASSITLIPPPLASLTPPALFDEDQKENLVGQMSTNTSDEDKQEFHDVTEEETLVGDILVGDEDEDEGVEADTDGQAQDSHANILWKIPVSNNLHSSYYSAHILTFLQSDLSIDPFLDMTSLQILGTPRPSNITRHLRCQGYPHIQFDAPDLNRLASSTSRLNDVCLNGGAAVLQNFYSSPTLCSAPHSLRCAILSTFDLPRVRYRASDQDLWRNIRHSSYWSKDTWIIPIHRSRPAEHWVLAIASITSQNVYLFDSFAEAYPWRKEVKVCYYLYSCN